MNFLDTVDAVINPFSPALILESDSYYASGYPAYTSTLHCAECGTALNPDQIKNRSTLCVDCHNSIDGLPF